MQNLIGKNIGRYHILEQIGTGGMAVVYKAFDTRLEREVAIKFIRTEAIPELYLEKLLKRFEREAKALAQLNHPNIVTIYDYGHYENIPYLVLEYLTGGTFNQFSSNKQTWQNAVQLILPIAAALEYAHKRNILHRDVKPTNILIDEEGQPKLTDFGIASILSEENDPRLTQTGVGIGTPEYMSPEQCLGKKLTTASDVYALGIILYELITGKRPFIADTPMAVVVKHINDPLPQPGKLVKGLPKQVEQVLFKALAKEPTDRYQTMTEFIQALQKLLSTAGDPGKTELPVGTPKNNFFPKLKRKQTVPVVSQDTYDELEVQGGSTFINRDHKPKKSPGWKNNKNHLTLIGLLFFGGVVVIGVTITLVNIAGSFIPAPTETPRPTNTNTLPPTETKLPTSTPTITPSPTVTLTPTPTLGIGSRMISEKDGMEMVYVPAGSFIMGSESSEAAGDESPEHEVYLDAYWMDKYEVTNGQYKLCVEAGVCVIPFNISYYQELEYENHPVVYITWEKAKTYCEWASRDLPSEAQWEKAARGEDGRTYPWGEESPNANLLNYNQNVGGTSVVGSYPKGASPYGVMDIAGNVWEWVNDWYDSDYYTVSPEANPSGPANGDYRVFRGGSWNYNERLVHSSYRGWSGPEVMVSNGGFRCAMSEINNKSISNIDVIPTIPTKFQSTITQSIVYLYNGPDTSHKILGKLVEGDSVKIISRNYFANWFFVEGPQQENGWLYIDWLESPDDPKNIPTAQFIPTLIPTATATSSQNTKPQNTPPAPTEDSGAG